MTVIEMQRKYSIVRELSATLSEKLTSTKGATFISIILHRQNSWIDQTPRVDCIIEAYQGLLHHADRIIQCLRFISTKTQPDQEEGELVNAFLFLVPPSADSKQADRIRLIPESCILRIPANFTTETFDLQRFVSQIGNLLPHMLIGPQYHTKENPTKENQTKQANSIEVACRAAVPAGLD